MKVYDFLVYVPIVFIGVSAVPVIINYYKSNSNTTQASAENRPASRQLQPTNNPDFSSLLRRLDKDRNGVTTVEEIVEGFGEIAEKKGVYRHEYPFMLPDGSRQSLLIDLDYRER